MAVVNNKQIRVDKSIIPDLLIISLLLHFPQKLELLVIADMLRLLPHHRDIAGNAADNIAAALAVKFGVICRTVEQLPSLIRYPRGAAARREYRQLGVNESGYRVALVGVDVRVRTILLDHNLRTRALLYKYAAVGVNPARERVIADAVLDYEFAVVERRRAVRRRVTHFNRRVFREQIVVNRAAVARELHYRQIVVDIPAVEGQRISEALHRRAAEQRRREAPRRRELVRQRAARVRVVREGRAYPHKPPLAVVRHIHTLVAAIGHDCSQYIGIAV